MTAPGGEGPQRVPRVWSAGESHYESEQVEVFGRSWLFVAHESELPAPGGWLTRRMGTDSVIVSRDAEGFHVVLNSCSHRGTKLCRGDRGEGQRLRCMYHGWIYETSGRLVAVPGRRKYYSDDFSLAEHGLRAARVEVRAGLVFATWDHGGPDLATTLGAMSSYLEAFFGRPTDGFECLGPPMRWVSRSNWKLATENFGLDSLHLTDLHAGPLAQGIFGADEQLEEFGGTPRGPLRAWVVDCGHGHGIESTKHSGEPTRRCFLGYPENFWPEFEANIGHSQSWFFSWLSVLKGNVFPNLSFIDVVHTRTGETDDRPIAGVLLRQCQPLAPDRNEIWMWVLAPRSAPADWRQVAHRALVRTLGVGGSFEPDDLESGAAGAAGAAGTQGKDGDYIYAAGANFVPASLPLGIELPGRIVSADANTETMQRAFYREWRSRVLASG